MKEIKLNLHTFWSHFYKSSSSFAGENILPFTHCKQPFQRNRWTLCRTSA